MGLKIKNNVASVNALRHSSQSQKSLAESLERLSSGQKINRAGDNPAGLIISENLRAQIAGIEQAINNSEFTISMVQTAEGALTEVNNLLIQARQLSLAAANEGGNDQNTLLALQEQLSNALDSIDRVSLNTRFGNKPLLDGSRGIDGVSNSADLAFVGASEDTRSSPVEGFNVNISKLAKKASVSSTFSDAQTEGLTVSLSEGGRFITVNSVEGDSAETFAIRLKDHIEQAGLGLDVEYSKEAELLTVKHKKYGEDHSFVVTSSVGSILANESGIPQVVRNGQNVEGRINGEVAEGIGDILTGKRNNRTTDGLSVRYTGKNLGEVGSVSVAQNSLTFQIGPNTGQTIRVALEDTSSAALARGIENASGFVSLSDVDITSAQGAQDSLLFLDEAINKVSQIRGRLGAFQKNSLESNVTTLKITAENLIAAESSIRDTDVAQELAEFTRSRILTEASAAASAQANNLSNHAIGLLDRGLF